MYQYQPNANKYGKYTNFMDPSWVFLSSLCAHHNPRLSCHRLSTGAHWRYEDFEPGCAKSWSWWSYVSGDFLLCTLMVFFYMGVSEKRGKTPPKSSIFIGFSFINHPFWGSPIFGNTHIPGPSKRCKSNPKGMEN